MSSFDELWKGISVPTERDGTGDLRTSSGEKSVEEAIVQIVGTRKKSPIRPGELRWNQKFGCLLDELRHKNLHDSIMVDLGRHEIIDSVDRFEPRARITSASVEFEKRDDGKGRLIKPRIGFMVVSRTNERTESNVEFGF